MLHHPLHQDACSVLAGPLLKRCVSKRLEEGLGVLQRPGRVQLPGVACVEPVVQYLPSLHHPGFPVPLPRADATVRPRRPDFLIIVALRGLRVGEPLTVAIIILRIHIHRHHTNVLVGVVQALLGAGASTVLHAGEISAVVAPGVVAVPIRVDLGKDSVNPVVTDALRVGGVVVIIAGHVVRIGCVATGGECVGKVNLQHLHTVQGKRSIVERGIPRCLFIWLHRSERRKRGIGLDCSRVVVHEVVDVVGEFRFPHNLQELGISPSVLPLLRHDIRPRLTHHPVSRLPPGPRAQTRRTGCMRPHSHVVLPGWQQAVHHHAGSCCGMHHKRLRCGVHSQLHLVVVRG
mmetsp:Transcript_75338/g.201281  ORF Transcript_75338/g.201281 Transcript_75338/m.201281 type:complete len:346 (+) Transcript_75338:79-1116(+)